MEIYDGVLNDELQGGIIPQKCIYSYKIEEMIKINIHY